jgi:hypothetical protein
LIKRSAHNRVLYQEQSSAAYFVKKNSMTHKS